MCTNVAGMPSMSKRNTSWRAERERTSITIAAHAAAAASSGTWRRTASRAGRRAIHRSHAANASGRGSATSLLAIAAT